MSGQYGVSKFDTSGTFVLWFGEEGYDASQLQYASGIGLDPDGNVYVADKGNRKVAKYDGAGQLISEWQMAGDVKMSAPSDLAVDGSSNVYAVDASRNVAYKFDKEGTYLGKIGEQGIGEGKLDNPWGIDVDIHGAVYVSDKQAHTLQKFTPGSEIDDSDDDNSDDDSDDDEDDEDDCAAAELLADDPAALAKLRHLRDRMSSGDKKLGAAGVALYYRYSDDMMEILNAFPLLRQTAKGMLKAFANAIP